MEIPFFSIITATYNTADVLPRLLASLEAQTCQDFVWVCQDGASADDTLAIAKEWEGKIATSIASEKDTGIYDAWNKAIARQGDGLGEWVLFLGADDLLTAPDVLEKVKKILSTHTENILLAAGNILFLEEGLLSHDKRIVELDINFVNRLRGTPLPHSALFSHKEAFRKNLFRTDLKIISDWDWIIKTWQKKEQAIALNFFVTIMAKGGMSDREDLLLTICKENLCIMWEYRPIQIFPKIVHCFVIIKFFSFYCKMLLKEIFMKHKVTQHIWKHLKAMKNWLLNKINQ